MTFFLGRLSRLLLTLRRIGDLEHRVLNLSFQANFLIFLLCWAAQSPRDTIDAFYLVFLTSTTGRLLVAAPDLCLLASVTRGSNLDALG